MNQELLFRLIKEKKLFERIIIPYRGDNYDPFRLKVMGDLGQIYFHPYHLRDEESILKCMKYSNVVINLVGRDWETKNFKFDDVHAEGARMLARCAKKSGVERFIHLSALNASIIPPSAGIIKGGSKFFSSKAKGEEAVLEEFPEATIIRPADVYGQEDRFLRYYAHAWRRQVNYFPLWKKGEHTEKQPVYVGDVAAGIVNAVKDGDTAGKVYQAVGAKRYQLSELVDYFYRVMRKDDEWGYVRYDMRWDPLFQLKVTLTEKISLSYPLANLHWERIEREHVSDDVKYNIPTLEDLGVTLTPMEQQVPWELKPWTYAIYRGQDPDEPFTPAAPPKPVAV
ncbi:unnamed protein product [Acanthoscelides obtectus]|uniref:NADH dehydrogenase [ubiquinone] 1 alpha subcomplex subunit 9, mitochondrial n=1 Tax=Acanthoscelides obtectus TaxID=200917 RepID=A0A9P0M9S2_ACAOB|nr:unnamed protein product [Acanthoscelides obtectus]CAK1659215.1 NADH dehydrogenase [ubiquinone] 1 alpha subcomplex subunit 9, mitochondrial [Acanthoscelides obtectus]